MIHPQLNPLELTGRAATHIRDAPGGGARLHAGAIDAVNALREACARAGHDLAIVSSFRDFSRQSGIWNRKFRGEQAVFDRAGVALDVAAMSGPERVRAILVWSALPGASRHHWGSDFDVYDRAAVPADYRPELTVAEYTGSGPFARFNEWLGANLGNHGLFRPYRTDRGGVSPEPWHLSYTPVSGPALQALTLDVLTEAIEGSDLEGREHVLAQLPRIHDRYVMSIDAP
ncbi:MAG: M15 family metallopeptidase [Gammaproteobacteria bacterium]